MVRTLTLNPAIDKTVIVERFAIGRVNRIRSVRLDAGGKGINVARVLHQARAEVLAVAPVGGAAGQVLVERLAAEGIPFGPVTSSNETRTNLKVVDSVLGTHTDINEPGSPLTDSALLEIEHRLLGGLGPGDWVVCSGSVPPGVEHGIYARWLARARQLGARTALDADGAAFSRGLAAEPDLIKPNRDELEAWFGEPLSSEKVILEAVAALRGAGAQTVALSLGEEGAWLFHRSGAWFAPAVSVEVQSTVGAGDALLAGLVLGLSSNGAPSETLGKAVALATARVARLDLGGDPIALPRLRERVQVRRVL